MVLTSTTGFGEFPNVRVAAEGVNVGGIGGRSAGAKASGAAFADAIGAYAMLTGVPDAYRSLSERPETSARTQNRRYLALACRLKPKERTTLRIVANSGLPSGESAL